MDSLTKPKTMRAAFLVELKKPLVIDEVELPEQLGYGQVLVRMVYSGICGAQLNEIDGAKGEDKFLPHLLGHEASAIVVETGPGVKTVTPGQRVVLHWRKGRGIEANPPQLRWRGRPLNAGWVTTFSQYSIVSENRVTPLPDGVEMDVAPLFGCAVTTGLGVISNNAHLRIGESVVVFGAGGVGLNVIQGAQLAGAYRIIAVDTVPYKLQLAQQFGATHAVNSSSGNAVAEVQALANGHLDYAFEVVGLPVTVRQAWDMIRPGGMAVVVGLGREEVSIPLGGFLQEKKLIGSLYGSASIQADIPRLVDLYMDGRIKLDELVSRRRPLAEINQAFQDMEAGVVARSMVVPG